VLFVHQRPQRAVTFKAGAQIVHKSGALGRSRLYIRGEGGGQLRVAHNGGKPGGIVILACRLGGRIILLRGRAGKQGQCQQKDTCFYSHTHTITHWAKMSKGAIFRTACNFGNLGR
jgi:hypothetical protein